MFDTILLSLTVFFPVLAAIGLFRGASAPGRPGEGERPPVSVVVVEAGISLLTPSVFCSICPHFQTNSILTF